MEQVSKEECISNFDEQIESLRKLMAEPGNQATYKITISAIAPELRASGEYHKQPDGNSEYKYIPKVTWSDKTIFSQVVEKIDVAAIVKAVNGLSG